LLNLFVSSNTFFVDSIENYIDYVCIIYINMSTYIHVFYE
jgi:hypothetical protein